MHSLTWTPSGATAQTGWVSANGKWYYKSPSGAMVTDRTLTFDGKPFTFDANGVWIS